MRPTINVNLGGLQFVFNDDAYRLMKEYLESLREAFTVQNLDASELTTDIENRCAEILDSEHDRFTYIVTEEDITALIDRIGKPEEIIDIEPIDYPHTSDTAGTSQCPYPEPPAFTPLRKRLYRIKAGAELGGVCGGIAAYCNWDPTYVRLATVVLAFLSVSTVAIAYLILWIVIPQAKTPLQEMELRGESPTLNNIGRTVKETFGYSSENNEKKQYAPYEKLNTPASSNTAASGVARAFSILAKIGLGIVAIVCSLTVIALVVAVIAGCIYGIVSMISDYTLPPGFIKSFTSLMCGTIVVTIPFCCVVWLIVNALFRPGRIRHIKPAWRLSLFIVWIIAILILIKLMKYFQFADTI